MSNRFIRLASVILALVLATSCFVGGTFAKYVTAGNAEDGARVAKFGVVISASDSAFSTEYDTDDSDYSGSLSVKSDVKVLAPGTEGEFSTITLSGTPEVAVEVSYEVELSASDAWVNEAGEFYFPVNININGIVFVGSAYDNVSSLINDINRRIASDYTAVQFAAGTDFGELRSEAANFNVSWSWPYEHDPDYDAIGGNQNDIDDTYLGNQASKGNAPEIEVIVKVTVTQID